jgi:hypothetical protein
VTGSITDASRFSRKRLHRLSDAQLPRHSKFEDVADGMIVLAKLADAITNPLPLSAYAITISHPTVLPPSGNFEKANAT